MEKKTNVVAIIAYITWVGWIIALLVRDRNDSFATHHINQALVINALSVIGGVIAAVPLLGGVVSGIVGLVVLVLWCIGIYRAITGSTEPLPVIGDFRLIS